MFLLSGLNTWNINDNHVDIESELAVIADCAPPGEEARGGERHGLAQGGGRGYVSERPG